MRPTISWSDLVGARVAVWGLGVEGEANLRRLLTLGVEPVLVDDRGAQAAPGALPTDGPGLEAMQACQVVIKSPGISRHRPEMARLEAAAVAVTGGLALWLQEADGDRVVCVTGTKGKSTTTAVAGHLLQRLGHDVMVGGNLGVAPWDPEHDAAPDYWVVEVSSYQAADVARSPSVVAVTSLGVDHVPWHGSEEQYLADKLSLASQPGARVTVADGTSAELRRRADQLGPEVDWVEPSGDADREGWTQALGLPGRHNVVNALIAQRCLVQLGVADAGDPDALAEAAAGFPGLDSRLRTVHTADGVDFVDDSLSTNVLSALAAVDAFPDRAVALLVGGFDRDLDYTPLAEGLAARVQPITVVGMPDSGSRILEAVAEAAPAVETVLAEDLEEATRAAFGRARPDGVVLLSPAAPSFGRFRDYRERAAAFLAAAQTCH